jgi:hypothetical protein
VISRSLHLVKAALHFPQALTQPLALSRRGSQLRPRGFFRRLQRSQQHCNFFSLLGLRCEIAPKLCTFQEQSFALSLMRISRHNFVGTQSN